MRSRVIARVITRKYDDALRPYGCNAAQLVMLVVIHQIGPATRAEIGRFHHQDRSTLTRNLKVILAKHWVEEVADTAKGKGRSISLTSAGVRLVKEAKPGWKAAQVETKAMLGEQAAMVLTGIADGILIDKTSG